MNIRFDLLKLLSDELRKTIIPFNFKYWVEVKWDIEGWWLFDEKGYRHHYGVAVGVITPKDIDMKALEVTLGPVHLMVCVTSRDS